MNKISPQAKAALEAYIRDYPEEYAREIQRAREVVFKCTGVLSSINYALQHANGCNQCSHELGIFTIEVTLPKAPL